MDTIKDQQYYANCTILIYNINYLTSNADQLVLHCTHYIVHHIKQHKRRSLN